MTRKEQENGIEERVELSMLYDFYGALLKENQQQMFEAYILEDFSITEIAQNLGITRQGVHDALKRATRQLREYENKLGLVERFEKQKKAVKMLHDMVGSMELTEKLPQWGEMLQLLDRIVEEEFVD